MNFDAWLDLFKMPPKLSKKDYVLTLVPLVIWPALVFCRPALISPYCVQTELCTPEHVISVDRAAVALHNSKADHLSYLTQNTAGALLYSTPLLWQTALVTLGRIAPATGVLYAASDLLLGIQATLWNGAIMETVRVSVQRPRPFVYANPKKHGANPSHYVSFYSGHTSFVAVAMTTLFFLLLGRGTGPSVLWGTALMGVALTAATGVFRIFAGRHFFTDVLVAACAGTLIAFVLARIHKRKN